MKLVLVTPPPIPPAYPYLSVPTLTAFLRQHGHDVEQIDLNLTVWNRLVTPSRLREAYERLKAAPPSKRGQWLSERAADVLDEIEWAMDLMRGREPFEKADEYLRAGWIVRTALNLLSYSYGVKWTPENYYFPQRISKSEEAVAAAADPRLNVFESAFREEVGKWAESGCKVLGISVAFESQLVPSLALARIAKEMVPDLFVLLGGSYLTHLNDRVENLLRNCPWADGIVLFQGEGPLLELLEAMQAGGDLCTVSNLWWRAGDGSIRRNETGDGVPLERIPFPDFSDLELGDYLSPQLTLPVLASRGCYYGKCAFCAHHFSYGKDFSHRQNYRVIEEVERNIGLGAKCIYLVDEAVSPRIMIELARTVRERGWDLKWLAETRPEPVFAEVATELYKGGCRLISFGMESINQETIDKMGKSFHVPAVREVLANIHRAKITTCVTTMVGYPGESKEEAIRTLEFLLKTEDIDLFGLSPFGLLKNSPMYLNPVPYGLSYQENEEEDLTLAFAYRVEEGMNARETYRLVDQFFRLPQVWEHKARLELALTRSHLALLPGEQIRFTRS